LEFVVWHKESSIHERFPVSLPHSLSKDWSNLEKTKVPSAAALAAARRFSASTDSRNFSKLRVMKSDFPLQNLPQHVPMATGFVLGAMTHHRHRAPLAKRLQQAQRELLPEVLDGLASLVNCPALEEFLAVAAAEFAPSDFAGLDGFQKLLARTEARHPDIIAGRGQASTAKPGGQDSQSIFPRFDG
jgi:hypothetical protein